jgi:hypothetical protein
MVERGRHPKTRGFLKVFITTIMLTTLLCGITAAQQSQVPVLFKGTEDAAIWFGLVPAQHDGSTSFNTDFWMGGVRFGRVLTAAHGPGWLRGSLQWNINAVPLFIISNLQRTYGAEIDPLVWRWNFKPRGTTAPYFEMAAGIAATHSKVPVGDTSQFNIVPKIGFGWQIFRRAQNSIDLGIYAWHLSNAWTAPRNPSANGIQLTIGYHWYKTQNAATANAVSRNESASP